MKMRTIVLGAALAFGLATAAGAAITPAPIGNAGSAVVKIAEGCGPGFWRGPGGRCHPMAMGRACPRGYHLGPEGRRCWPD
ncbi:GCG_CRPN prefix-to-repeats domain-containing protein [Methylocapsa sp. S129]|uniref:GCG_CRPN prefix-to-repeats domain-containing protein n=1 Tax=Methylocapsa sp. S129 TaxID=1641869 RepID=UPI00352B26DB